MWKSHRHFFLLHSEILLSGHVLTQEQDNQNKVNMKKVSIWFSELEDLDTDQITSLILLYTQVIIGIYSNKDRLAGVTSALHRNLYWWAKNNVEKLQKYEVSGPLFLRKISLYKGIVVSYDHGTKYASIRHTNEFYKDRKYKHCIIQEIE